MAEQDLEAIRKLLDQCSPKERQALFRELRAIHQIHELENSLGAPAEVILEAIHRAPELTRRMLRGVIADAAFAQSVVPALADIGWKDVTPAGNHSFDYMLRNVTGDVSVQVKLQRSEKGKPLISSGSRHGLGAGFFVVEAQRTRTGKGKGEEGEEMKTRPYRYGEFDILAVSLQPTTGRWDSFLYAVGNSLLTGRRPTEIATYQPVAMKPNSDWTADFELAVQWFRSGVKKKIKNY